MSVQSLKAGAYNRWNNASLNSSIAALYPGNSRKSRDASVGTPEGTSKPRAQFDATQAPPNAKTRGSRIYQGILMFSVWGSDDATVNGYVDSIRDAFVNSDESGSSPFTMSGASVLDTNDSGAVVEKEDDVTFRGDITIIVDYRITNSVP